MSVASDVDFLEERAEALAQLRAARRRKRIHDLDKFEAFYKAYLTAILGTLAVYAAAGWLGNEPVTGEALQRVKLDSPLFLGILVAVVVAIGLRSGGRGGPLAFELADVRHVLMSPADRRDTVRSVAFRSLRHGAFVGACVGGAAGVVALRRLPGNPVEWVTGGVLFGAVTVATGYAVAMIASGLRVKSWLCDLLGFVFIVWASLAAWSGVEISPFTWLAAVATIPVGFDPLSIAGVAVAVASLAAAYFTAEGLSVETAERRSRLIGNLRFAATTQDIRTVMLIQRQLAQQHMRNKPWFRLRTPRRPATRATMRVSLRRSWQSLARWPAIRALRLLALVATAVACVIGAWFGTTALVVPAAVALWLGAMDLLEPLAQDTDHPDRTRSLAIDRGIVNLRLVIVPLVVMFVLVGGSGVALVLINGSEIAMTLLPLIVPIVMCSVAGAAIAISKQPSYGGGGMSALTPEIAGLAFAWRAFMPPAIAVLGMMPLAIGHTRWLATHDLASVNQALNLPFAGALVAATWSLLWLRYEDQLRATFTPKPTPNTEAK